MGCLLFRSPETKHDLFWYKNFSTSVLAVTAFFEEEAYRLLVNRKCNIKTMKTMKSAERSKGARRFQDLGKHATRKGRNFRTPISNGKRTYEINALKHIINDQCEALDWVQCRALTGEYRLLTFSLRRQWKMLRRARVNLPSSYEHVQGFWRSSTRDETFCQQLSDQLVVCEQCQGRPILFNLIKDEHAMEQHLFNHQQETTARTQLYERLMSTLVQGQDWWLDGKQRRKWFTWC